MTVREEIEQFCGYFRDQVQVIQSVALDAERANGTDQESHQTTFYKKVLLVTQIDTIAGIRYSTNRYPKLHRSNHDRFIKFLNDHQIWPLGGTVSIPFVREAGTGGRLSNGKLKTEIENRFNHHFEPDAYHIDCALIDMDYSELLELSSNEQEEALLREYTHYELLYRYRNYLVHEGRVPGNAMEIGDDERPYYHSYLGEDKLFLAYPLNLFVSLASQSIDNLEQYLTFNQFNPYDFVSETSIW